MKLFYLETDMNVFTENLVRIGMFRNNYAEDSLELIIDFDAIKPYLCDTEFATVFSFCNRIQLGIVDDTIKNLLDKYNRSNCPTVQHTLLISQQDATFSIVISISYLTSVTQARVLGSLINDTALLLDISKIAASIDGGLNPPRPAKPKKNKFDLNNFAHVGELIGGEQVDNEQAN